MTTHQKRIAVVGAGISGLTCAYELQRAGFAVTVYEKETFVGGRMSSRTKDGFIFDLGADHLCDLYVHMKAYCTEFGIPWEKMRFLQYGLFRDGKVLTMGQAIGRFSKARLAMQYFLTRDIGDFFDLNHLAMHDKENAYTFMKRRAGKEVSDYFVDAFTSTYQFHRASEISVGALLGIMRSIQKDKDKWDLHRTKGGMEALPNAFASRLTVKTGTPIADVVAGDNGVEVRVGDDVETFDIAVLAATAPATLVLYKNPTEKQKRMLQTSKYAATISVAFRVDRTRLPDVAVVWVPYVESQKISGYVNEAMKGEEVVREGKSLVCAWLHEEFAEKIMHLSNEEIFSQVKAEFVRVCPWFDDVSQVENHDMQKWPHAMPKFAHGHLTAVERFMTDGQGEQKVFFCGDYLNSPWTEGALRNGQRVAKDITDRVHAGLL